MGAVRFERTTCPRRPRYATPYRFLLPLHWQIIHANVSSNLWLDHWSLSPYLARARGCPPRAWLGYAPTCVALLRCVAQHPRFEKAIELRLKVPEVGLLAKY